MPIFRSLRSPWMAVDPKPRTKSGVAFHFAGFNLFNVCLILTQPSHG